ncbi:alpha/beta hydrolase [Mangrovivirga sp. M17]|uniref:Alpha/beta hydrolase n=1 Tax=Mangrovivirga halotolerans TaxID=2993936 RepID=A0ABT3RNE8_9BACT|nr:alpha/beta hydrolase [Mangrovivirga halotolerans]MCX2743333.1 alpha/beta hydrolase [Mangrovivirga halotolerans]
MKKLGKFIKLVFATLLIIIALTALFFGHSNIPLEELKAKYANDASAFISINGADVHYRDEGNQADSLPIVLIHGTGASLHTFNVWANELKSEHRVVRMDLPGYGLTGPFANQDYSIDHYVDFLNTFLDSLNIDNCILAGNSLGGHIAWRFTDEYPEKVNKLILIDAAGYPFKSKSRPLAFQMAKIPVVNSAFTFITPRFVVKSSIKNVYVNDSKVTEELIDRYFELTLRKGNRQAFVDAFDTRKNTEAYKNIPSIKKRTLVLWGAQDDLIPVDQAHRFHEDLPNDTLVILDNAGHVPMEEVPNRSLTVVRDFISE